MANTRFSKLVITIALVLLTLLVVIGIFGPHKLGARALADKLQAEISDDLQAKDLRGLSVNMHGQKAVLSGIVPTEATKNELKALTLSSAGSGGWLHGGVTGVNLKSVAVIPIPEPYTFNLRKTDSDIEIGGHMASQTHFEALKSRFGDSQDISAVDLSYHPYTPLDDWSVTIQSLSDTVAKMDMAEIKVSDNSIVVTGDADSLEKALSIKGELATIPSDYTITSDIYGPASWSAEKSETGFELKGVAPHAVGKSALASIAEYALRTPITDNQIAASTHNPDDSWVLSASKLLPGFTQFETGQLSYHGNGFKLSGVTTESSLSFIKSDIAKIAHKVRVNVTTKEVEVQEIADYDFETAETLPDVCQDAYNVIMANNKLYFGTGSATITRQSGETLDKIIVVARKCDTLEMTIEGHTDNTGDAFANQRLSESRAQAVLSYFTSQSVNTAKMTARGYGADAPIVPNNSSENRAKNRRIEFEITASGGE